MIGSFWSRLPRSDYLFRLGIVNSTFSRCLSENLITFIITLILRNYSTTAKEHQLYAINIQAVIAARLARNGEACLKKFLALMNMAMPPSDWTTHQSVTEKAFLNRAEKSMAKAVEEEKNGSENQEVSASFDGSWMRRGFQSLVGFVSSIGLLTKKVLGVDVRHKYCPSCKGKTNSI